MQVLPRCGHCVHEDAPDKVRLISMQDSTEGRDAVVCG